MKDKNNYNAQDIPLGLSMAMAQNPMAFSCFSKLTTNQKEQVLEDSHNAHSKREMQQLVDNLASGEFDDGTISSKPFM